MREVISIAKNFQNAYLDMCWLHIISRKAAKDFLEEALEAVPLSKIFGFGGDFMNVEGTYAHLKIARQNISSVLTKLIEEERIDKKEALKISKMVLYDNPSIFYKI
jgi:predicted TIM-barrel fold metal-dependent hydrolase